MFVQQYVFGTNCTNLSMFSRVPQLNNANYVMEVYKALPDSLDNCILLYSNNYIVLKA